jgi:hypothetical protein
LALIENCQLTNSCGVHIALLYAPHTVLLDLPVHDYAMVSAIHLSPMHSLVCSKRNAPFCTTHKLSFAGNAQNIPHFSTKWQLCLAFLL